MKDWFKSWGNIQEITYEKRDFNIGRRNLFQRHCIVFSQNNKSKILFEITF